MMDLRDLLWIFFLQNHCINTHAALSYISLFHSVDWRYSYDISLLLLLFIELLLNLTSPDLHIQAFPLFSPTQWSLAGAGRAPGPALSPCRCARAPSSRPACRGRAKSAPTRGRPPAAVCHPWRRPGPPQTWRRSTCAASCHPPTGPPRTCPNSSRLVNERAAAIEDMLSNWDELQLISVHG